MLQRGVTVERRAAGHAAAGLVGHRGVSVGRAAGLLGVPTANVQVHLRRDQRLDPPVSSRRTTGLTSPHSTHRQPDNSPHGPKPLPRHHAKNRRRKTRSRPLTRFRFAPAGLPSRPASRRRIWAASRTIAPRRSSRRTRSAGARVRAAPPRMRRARRVRTRRSRRATVQGARRASGRRVWHPPRRHRPSRHPPSAPHHPPHHPRTAGAAQPDAGRPGLRGAE